MGYAAYIRQQFFEQIIPDSSIHVYKMDFIGDLCIRIGPQDFWRVVRGNKTKRGCHSDDTL